jgi:hypothetical protein
MPEIIVLAVIGLILVRHHKAVNMAANGDNKAPKVAFQARRVLPVNSVIPVYQTVAGRVSRPFWRGEGTIPNGRPKGGAPVQTVAAPNSGRQSRGWNAVRPILDPIDNVPANKFANRALKPVQYAAPVGALENQNGGAEVVY